MKITFAKITLSTVSLIAIASTSLSAQAKSLDDALVVAYKTNPQLMAARENVKVVDETLPQTYASWLPNLTASYSLGSFEDDNDITQTQSTQEGSSLNYSQNLFNGGRSFYTVRQVQNNILAARAELHQTEQVVLTNAIAAYIDVVRLRRILALSQNNEKVLTEQLKATVDRFDLGETTRTDVAQSKARLAVAISDRVSAEGNLIEADANYFEIFGEATDTEMAFPKDLAAIPEKYDIILEKTMANYPPLKAAEYNQLASEATIKINRGNLFPSVDLNGTVSRDESRRSISGGGDLNSSSITVNVSVPLYQGGDEYSNIRRAKKNANRLKQILMQQRNAAVNNARVTWKDILTTKAKIKANESAVKAATIALEGVRQEQEIGSRTTLDVLDQEQELFSAEIDLVNSQRNAVLAQYNVLASMGKLTIQDLKINTPVYNPKVHYDKVKYKLIGF